MCVSQLLPLVVVEVFSAQNLMESVHGVDAHIGTADLATLGFAQLHDKWKEMTLNYPVTDPTVFFVLRDSNWAKLGDVPVDAIYARFLSQSNKRGGPSVVFKPPKNAWIVFLEIPQRHKLAIDEHIEAKELEDMGGRGSKALAPAVVEAALACAPPVLVEARGRSCKTRHSGSD